MQNRDEGSQSGIIDLLRTTKQNEKKSASEGAPSSELGGQGNLRLPSSSQITDSQFGLARLNTLSGIPHHLFQEQLERSFLANSIGNLPSSLTATQRDLLLLSSLQGSGGNGALGLGYGIGMLGGRPLGGFGLTPTLPLLSGIDAAMMPSVGGSRQALGRNLSQSLMAARLEHQQQQQHSAPKYDDMAGKRSESFPEKLHRLLLEVEYEGKGDIISFTPDGHAFQIHKPQEFFDKIVPQYFNQSHLSSFKRQLNLYGFEAITSGTFKGAYYHQDFQRLRPELCRLIHRRNQKWRSPDSKT
eukprot:scaffold1157_cov122-Cylindrotheca_fusiformis.AAC.21